MKKLLYVLTGLCLLAGLFAGCEKPEKESEKAISTIQGVVTDKETGETLSGVTIEIQPTGRQVQTAEDGTYIFENLKAGAYTLKAQKEGYADYENVEIWVGVEQTLIMDIEMGEYICALTGKVMDKKTGSLLSGVIVELQPIGQQVQIAEDGIFCFDSLKAMKYTLRAQKDGYIDYIKEDIQLISNQIMVLDIEMSEIFLEFQMLDEKDKSIEELECFGTECSFKLVNTGNIAGAWSIEMEFEADWITEISPKSGCLAAGATQFITLKRQLQEDDKETVITLKTEREDLQLKIISKGFVMEMVYVEGGTFEMGELAEQGDDVQDNEKPVRTVKLDSYHIGKYEVTQAQWKSVMGTEPSVFKGDNLPVEIVSWIEAQEFCKRLSEATGKKYVLPTEAQWEYAARGGNKNQHYKYAGSNDIDEVAWYDRNSEGKTHHVGTKKANELGIYDMSGNVWEWCSDWYDTYDENDTENPQGPVNGSYRVIRGGSCNDNTIGCRMSRRISDTPYSRYYILGFRVVCVSE